MGSIATITPAAETVKASPGGSVEHTFTVTNTSGQPLRVGVRVLPSVEGEQPWFSVEGGAERDLADQATDQFTVRVRLPADAAPGRHTFRVLVFSTRRPGEDFTEGPMVAVEVEVKQVEPPAPSRPFPWWIPVIVVMVLAVGGGLAWWLWPSAPEVPDLQGMTQDQAEEALAGEGLVVGDVTEELTGGAAGGEVIRQAPDPGTEVEKGSGVDLVLEAVSVEVPKLVGEGVVAAEEALAAVGLEVGEISQRRTGSAEGGTVLEQTPPAGQRVPPQTSVALVVEAESVRVPRVIGQTVAEARQTLSDRGLRLGAVTQRSAGGTPGVVLNQRPEEGQAVAPGAAVALTIEKQTVQVPKLTGIAVEEALRRIANEGLRAGSVTKRRSGKRAGTVLSQTPAPGAEVQPGSEVALVVEDQPPPPPKIHSKGTLDIKQTFTADLDEGKTGAGSAADVFFHAITATERYLEPRSKAKIALVGTRPVGRDGCAKANLGTGRIPVSRLRAGTYVCVLTNQNRYSELKVLGDVGRSPGVLKVQYTTWEPVFTVVPGVLLQREWSKAVGPQLRVQPK